MSASRGSDTMSEVAVLRQADIELALQMHRRFVIREVLLQWTEPRILLVFPLLGLSTLIWSRSGPDRVGRAIALVFVGALLFGLACQVFITIVGSVRASLSRRTLTDLAERVRRSPSGSYALPFRTDENGLVVGSGSGARRHRWEEFETVLVADALLLVVGKAPLLLPIPCRELAPALRELIIGKLPSPE